MPTLRGKVSRSQFPAGRDGQALVLDTASPHGIAWRSGIDRLITDITPELAGDLDCNGFDLTSVGNIGFSAVTGTLAGIQNQNLLDKTAAESIAGIYTHNADIVMADNSVTGLDTLEFTDTSGTIATIQNQNLLDKSATETVAGAWTFGAALTVATPSAGTDAATKAYVDTAVGATPLDRAWMHANYTQGSVAYNTLAVNTDHWYTPATWTVRDSNNWTQVASSGEFTYGGDFPAGGTRKFLVSWALSAQGYANQNYWNNKVRVTKKPSGGSHTLVPGSVVSSTWYGGLSIFGVILLRPTISGSCIVSIASGDTIGLDFGHYCNNLSGIATFNVGSWYTEDDGIIITITPADINP
jgi:hypothetical protein